MITSTADLEEHLCNSGPMYSEEHLQRKTKWLERIRFVDIRQRVQRTQFIQLL